ncbi:MAG: WG repeat-containing protein [Verrucomicrobia bacterium]|nr:WG repeat-containing protein [Verrucomicrobiota bacterium]
MDRCPWVESFIVKNDRALFLFLAILIPFLCRANEVPRPGLAGGRFVYLDASGAEAWPETWDWAWPFTEDRAGVRRGPRWNLLDRQGKSVGDARFDWVGLFEGGLAPARQGSKWGYLNREGKWAIAPFYSDARPFCQGVAAVQVGGTPNVVSKVDQLAGLPAFYGKLAKKIDLSVPASSGGKWALINSKDQYLVPPKYEAILEASQGLVLYRQGGAWGYLNLKGEVAISAQYLKASPFCDGLAMVTLMNCRTGKIDRQGQFFEKEKLFVQELKDSRANLGNVATSSGGGGAEPSSSR